MTNLARRPARPSLIVALSLVLAATAWLGTGAAAPSTAIAAGPILTVDRTDDVAAASGCTDTPDDCSLRGATINANADGNAEIETIVVPAGTYVLSAPGAEQLGGSLDVNYSARLVGAGSATTIIDANSFDRAFVLYRTAGPMSERVIELSGMTVRNGDPCVRGHDGTGGHTAGGGIFSGAITTLSDMVIENNQPGCPQRGGGIWSGGVGASLSISNSVIRGNIGPSGGGGLVSSGTTSIVDSTIDGNVSHWHGGGVVLAGDATISGSTISNNTGVGLGGGIFAGDDTTDACCAATIRIVNSTLSGNVALHHNSGTPQYFPGTGGAIGIKRSALVIEDSTITRNLAAPNPVYFAEGVAGAISMGYHGSLDIRRSIVAGNTARNECSLGTTVVTGSDSIAGGCGVGSSADPLLGALAANGGPTLTHAPLVGSPAIDTAGGTCPATDQRGVTRPQGAGCDIGSFEVEAAGPLDIDIGDCDDPALASIRQVDGSLSVSDPSCPTLSLPLLDSVGGDMTLSGAPTLTTIDAPELDSVGGNFDISNDATLTVIGVPSLDTVGGDMTFTADPTLTTIDAPELDSVGGNVDVSTTGASLDLTGVAVAGNTSLAGDGTTLVDTQTAGGSTAVSLVNGLASASVVLPTGAFPSPVLFALEALGGAPAEGDVSPLVAYRLTARCVFPLCGGSTEVPTLQVGAPVSLGIDLAGLDAAGSTALVGALADGRATVAVKADATGSAFAALPVCATGETPVANGCVSIAVGGSLVQFDAVATHFSTWAVVIVAPPPVFVPARTLGEWKADRTGTASLLPQRLGDYVVGTLADAKSVFDATNCSKSKAADAIGCLAGHLLTAELNLAAGIAARGVADVARADRFLRAESVDGIVGIRYAGPGTYALGKVQRSLALSLKNALDAYNNGLGCNA